MLLVLVLVFIVAPIVELFFIVQVASSIGVLETALLLVGISFVGVWLARIAGLGVLNRLQRTVRAGKVPSNELVDGALVLLAGALLVAPGFVSDALAVLLLLPPSRAVVRNQVVRRIRARGTLFRVVTTVPTGHPSATTEIWDVESWEDPPERPGLGR